VSVWVVSELYYPEETSTGYILTEIAEGLAARALTVGVICGQPTYAARGVRAPWNETRGDVRIHRCRSTVLDKDSIVGRILNIASLSVTILLTAVRRFRSGDVVMVVTNPPTLPALVYLAASLRRARTVMIVHDIYPDLAVAAGAMRESAPVARLMRLVNSRLYRRAAAITVLGRDMARRLNRAWPSTADKTVVLPNWADLEIVEPRPRSDNKLLKELDLLDHFVVQYAGNMGRPNAVEDVLDAASLLCHDDSIHFLFIGSGAKRQWLSSQIEARGLRNVTLLASKPRSESPDFLNACDVALVALVDKMEGVSVPSRTYNILAAGKPLLVVAGEGSEPALVVRECDGGWVVPPGNPDRLAEVIVEAERKREALPGMGARARRYAVATCTKQATIDGYEQLVRNLE
jgi:colanic acid biosynthesis glycosyl transferase WcaI